MRRTPIAVITALVLTASSVAIASPAQATTICNPVTYNYEVREAGAGIGNLLVRTNICMNGSTMSSSTGARCPGHSPKWRARWSASTT